MTTSKRSRPVELTDAPEHRSTPRFEVRESGDTVTLEGYASTFEPYEMYGGPANYGWIEQIGRSAFDKTLTEKPDLHLLINHEGMPLARTKSGTLDLSVDNHGLKVRAELDRSDPDVQRLEAKMRRGDMDEMSFAFRVKSQSWSVHDDYPEDNHALRTITEVSLHKGDVSVVNFGANPTTSAEVKSVEQALELLSMCAPEELVEARSSGGEDVIRRAQAVLEMLTRGRSTTVVGFDGKPVAVLRSDTDVTVTGTKPEVRTEPEAKSGGRKPLSLHEALIRQGLADPDGPMSLHEASGHLGEATDDPDTATE